ncbi:MAG: LytTR family DNA-binding domain-containing protein [Oscillospiraceae bacterium]|nr:LytTR family DNA-binding domain-containing protein [Oscillospiraceae bacterium]
MLRIAICDDNEHVCVQMKEFCASFLGDSINYELLIFNDGLQLTNYEQHLDIVFLDIEMPFLDGFKAAEDLNKRNRDTRIIFLTNYSEMMQKAFKVKAFRYLVKPVNEEDLKESLAEAIKDVYSNTKVIVDCSEAEVKTEIIVYEKDIMYIEAIGDGSVIYTVDQGNLISRKPLKYWEEKLADALFFQTHKSFIVSLAYVTSVRKNSVTILGGAEVPLAKRKAAIFNDYVAAYIKSI